MILGDEVPFEPSLTRTVRSKVDYTAGMSVKPWVKKGERPWGLYLFIFILVLLFLALIVWFWWYEASMVSAGESFVGRSFGEGKRSLLGWGTIRLKSSFFRMITLGSRWCC